MEPRRARWPKSARATSRGQTAAPGPRPTRFGTSMAGPRGPNRSGPAHPGPGRRHVRPSRDRGPGHGL
eukprot:15444646-Alexandrium_andersonii.AAC.1